MKHPKNLGIANAFKVSSFLHVWRSHEENFHSCLDSDFVKKWERMAAFDLKEYKNIIRKNNNGILPDGYYYCDHKTQHGGFLFTDDYEEMIQKLKDRGLIF